MESLKVEGLMLIVLPLYFTIQLRIIIEIFESLSAKKGYLYYVPTLVC